MPYCRVGSPVLTVGLLVAALLASMLLTSAQAARTRHSRRPPPKGRAAPIGAYVHNRVTTLADLKYQVARYDFVRQRFAVFFHRRPSDIPAFVDRNISAGKVAATQIYTVYYISELGRVIKHRQTLYAGAPVFVLTRTGQPVLNWDCGNPIEHRRVGFVEPVSASRPRIDFGRVAGAGRGELIALISPEEVLSTPALFVPGYPLVPLPLHQSPPYQSPNLLPLAMLVVSGVGRHHPSPPPAVPEPSALGFLIAGLSVLGVVRRRVLSERRHFRAVAVLNGHRGEGAARLAHQTRAGEELGEQATGEP